MITHEYVAGAFALPVVVALASVEPALGLVVGFTVYAGALNLPKRAVRSPRLSETDVPTEVVMVAEGGRTFVGQWAGEGSNLRPWD
jgi:hypothetical protein